MVQRTDLVAYDPDGQITLVAEVKSKVDTSKSWAARMRRNMLAHGTLPNARFFLLALPDRLYIWKDVGNIPDIVDPTYEIDAKPFLKSYYEKAGVLPENISGQSFELIITSWLNELLQSGIPSEIPKKQREALQNSGLLDALKGGRVEYEVFV